MRIYLFPSMVVISQIKAYTFSASMENQAVKLRYLSETQNNANRKHPQNNQLEALHLWKNKLPKMENIWKLSPVCPILTSDGLSIPVYVCLCLPSYCCLSVLSVHASQKKKQVKKDLNCSTLIYRVIMPVHDFKCNVDTTAYHKDEHQNRNVRLPKIKLRFISGRHIFIILLTSGQKCYTPICPNYICPPFFSILGKHSFSYCLWLYCLCLGLPGNNESKGNATTNRKRKKVCTITNKRLVNSSEMLPIYLYHCRVVCKKLETVNVCICLPLYIISFLKVTFFSETVLAKKTYNLELIWVEAYYHLPFTEIWNQAVTLHMYIVRIVYISSCFSTDFSLIKKILTIILLACVYLFQQHICRYDWVCKLFSYMRLFVETETTEWRLDFTVNSTAGVCFYLTVQKKPSLSQFANDI